MTPKYWLRIALGMLAIFAIGMVITSGIRAGRDQVGYIVEGSGPLSVPLLGMGFTLDDENLGGIERLRLMRSQPKVIDSAVVVVNLNDPAAASRFANCQLTVRDAQHLNDKTTFFCADSSDAIDLELIPFGHVEFKPSGEQVVIWLPTHVVADLREGGADGETSESGDVDVASDEHGLQVTVNGREVVSMRGDSAGGALTVRDAEGRTVLRLNGDDSVMTAVTPPPVPGNPRQVRVRSNMP